MFRMVTDKSHPKLTLVFKLQFLHVQTKEGLLIFYTSLFLQPLASLLSPFSYCHPDHLRSFFLSPLCFSYSVPFLFITPTIFHFSPPLSLSVCTSLHLFICIYWFQINFPLLFPSIFLPSFNSSSSFVFKAKINFILKKGLDYQ